MGFKDFHMTENECHWYFLILRLLGLLVFRATCTPTRMAIRVTDLDAGPL